MPFEERYELLICSGQVSRPAVEAAKYIVRMAEHTFGLILSETNGAMFVTHLVMALERMCRGEAIGEVSETIVHEAEGLHEEIKFVEEAADYLAQRLEIAIPPGEKALWAAHLGALRTGR